MRFKAVFNQAVEGIERVEVVVEADDVENALYKIELGDFERYRVINHDFARTNQVGTVELVEID